MTQDEFFDHLQSAKEKGFEWFTNNVHAPERLFIRARKRFNGEKSFCPITLVLMIVKNEYLDSFSWNQAAERMELDQVFAKQVIGAADDNTFGRAEAIEIRRRLWEVSELEEPVATEA